MYIEEFELEKFIHWSLSLHILHYGQTSVKREEPWLEVKKA